MKFHTREYTLTPQGYTSFRKFIDSELPHWNPEPEFISAIVSVSITWAEIELRKPQKYPGFNLRRSVTEEAASTTAQED